MMVPFVSEMKFMPRDKGRRNRKDWKEMFERTRGFYNEEEEKQEEGEEDRTTHV